MASLPMLLPRPKRPGYSESPIDYLRLLEEGPEYWFRDWPNQAVPAVCAGVYTVWKGREFIYAGMSGRGLSEDAIAERREGGAGSHGLFKRLRSHARGRRSGDQFCVYVADRLVLPELCAADIHAIITGTRKFDALVRDYIHQHFSYRFVEAPDGPTAFQLEAEVCRGTLRAGKPFLNPRS